MDFLMDASTETLSLSSGGVGSSNPDLSSSVSDDIPPSCLVEHSSTPLDHLMKGTQLEWSTVDTVFLVTAN